MKTAEQALLEVLDIVRRYLPPDGISVQDAMCEIIGCVDPWPLATPPAAGLAQAVKAGLAKRFPDDPPMEIAAPQPPAASQPTGFVLVPKRLTRAMSKAMEQEGWEWADILVAAEAITEDEQESIMKYDSLAAIETLEDAAAQPPAASQPSSARQRPDNGPEVPEFCP